MGSSFYGTSSRQSTILGEDPLFNDHDPVALIDIARKGTQGFTKSSSKLSKTLTTIGLRRDRCWNEPVSYTHLTLPTT